MSSTVITQEPMADIAVAVGIVEKKISILFFFFYCHFNSFQFV